MNTYVYLLQSDRFDRRSGGRWPGPGSRDHCGNMLLPEESSQTGCDRE